MNISFAVMEAAGLNKQANWGRASKWLGGLFGRAAKPSTSTALSTTTRGTNRAAEASKWARNGTTQTAKEVGSMPQWGQAGLIGGGMAATGIGGGIVGKNMGYNSGYDQGTTAGYHLGNQLGYQGGFTEAAREAKQTPFMNRIVGNYQFNPRGYQGPSIEQVLQQLQQHDDRRPSTLQKFTGWY